MINILKKDWLIWLILLAPFAVIAYFWNQFPEQIPMHWNTNGEVDRYGSKVFGLLFAPLLNIGTYFLIKLLPFIDPKRQNYALFSGKLAAIHLVIHLFLSGIAVATALYSLGYEVNMENITKFGVIGLILILGNYMGTIRPNYFVGVKTPWTLANDEVWIKTHRLTGKLWVFSSLIMLVLSLLIPFSEVIFIAYIVLIALVPMVYSYLLYRKLQHS